MSLKSILHDVGKWISDRFKTAGPIVKKAVDFAVKLTDAVNNFDHSNPGVVDFLTAIIPGDADKVIVAKVREKLPEIVVELKLVDATLGLTDPNEILVAASKAIQQLDGDYKSAFLHSFALLVARAAADGKLGWDDAIYLSQWFFRHKDDPTVDTTVDD